MDNKKDKEKQTSNVINIRGREKSCSEADKAADIFAESIKEEIQQENWQNLWRKYGAFITSLTAGLLIVFGVYGMWQKKDLEEREAISAEFSSVQNLIMSGDTAKAINQLKEMTHVNSKNYAILAKMEYAGILLNNGDKKALKEYQSVCNDSQADSLFKNLAYILYTNAAIDLMDQKTLSSNINTITAKLSDKSFQDGPWQFIAKEALAFCHIKSGNKNTAKKILEDLVKTNDIPEGIAERSRMLIQSLGE